MRIGHGHLDLGRVGRGLLGGLCTHWLLHRGNDGMVNEKERQGSSSCRGACHPVCNGRLRFCKARELDAAEWFEARAQTRPLQPGHWPSGDGVSGVCSQGRLSCSIYCIPERALGSKRAGRANAKDSTLETDQSQGTSQGLGA